MSDARHPPRRLTCPLCEREFVTRSPNGRYCRECSDLRRCEQVKAWHRAHRPAAPKRPQPGLTRGQVHQAMVCAGLQGCRTVDGIKAARTKPPHMSAVRWRIELRRRASPGWYDLMPERPVSSPVARPVTTSNFET